MKNKQEEILSGHSLVENGEKKKLWKGKGVRLDPGDPEILVKQASKWRTWWWWKHHIHILPRLIPGPKFLGVEDGDPVEVHPFECQSEVSAWMACGYLGTVAFLSQDDLTFLSWDSHCGQIVQKVWQMLILRHTHTRFWRACTCFASVLKTVSFKYFLTLRRVCCMLRTSMPLQFR